LTGEDTVAAAKLLRKGHKIAYTADAVVKHSHNYSLLQEFKRYYDTGYARKEYADLIEAPSRDTRRGSQYTQLMIKSLLKTDPWRLPYGVIQCFVKFAGYKIGQSTHRAPNWVKKMLSSQSHYWNGNKASPDKSIDKKTSDLS
jgi:rhamnosyltransferase